MAISQKDSNFKEDRHFKSEPIAAVMDDIPQIKAIGYEFWQKGGVYPQHYYISVIKQNLSFVIKVKRYLIIAVCLVRYNEKNDFIGIDLLCVKKEYQKKGIGKLLLSYCIENCKKLGYKNFYLHVATTNLPAFNLYQKLGFKISDTIKNYYFNDAPPNNDAYLMKLIIENNNEDKMVIEIKSDEKCKSKNKEENEKNNFNDDNIKDIKRQHEYQRANKNNISVNNNIPYNQNHGKNEYNINNEIYNKIYDSDYNIDKYNKKYTYNSINIKNYNHSSNNIENINNNYYKSIQNSNYNINNNFYNNIPYNNYSIAYYGKDYWNKMKYPFGF